MSSEERKSTLTGKSIEQAEKLNQMLVNESGRIEYNGRYVVQVLALKGDKIRLLYKLDSTDPDQYTDVPYNEYLRITR